jgi:AcrR family transcriptional regulator
MGRFRRFAGELTARQEHVLLALLAHPRVDQAAKRAGVARSTVYRFLADPIFQAVYRRAREQEIQRNLDGLLAASEQAIRTLRTVMSSRKASPSARVSAARTALDALQQVRLSDIETRLAQIEEQHVSND